MAARYSGRPQMQRLKALLEVRQHDLRLSIGHHQQYARRMEPEPDAVDQSASGSEKEALLQSSSREQELLRAIDSALGRIRTGLTQVPVVRQRNY